ncbi:ImmA/IrrE family metallo-endopeptidase [Hymenobacter rubidus]|uniref:ImmA/IrrE family metallo-endopeptidase n=1 Tax=Hymenobacter rubidus TaxID=1441626 RepID=UPI00191F2CFF|nr:XRE family transcriptional regulator [Hymenobacter rubidus]
MADKAFITPKVLRWARESARMSLETAAAKVPTTPEKLNDWEEGTQQPTVRQAETLAKAYRRPFALFFLPEIPRDFQPLQDFRTKNASPLGTASVFIIREMQQKQAWLHDVYEESGEKPLPFVGSFTLSSSPQQVAKSILSQLEINPSFYSTDNPIREWISKAEQRGIFISRTSFIHTRMKIDSEELQGFTIADSYAPFVFINSGDWDAPQLFTLVHELAHIWIAQSGISNATDSLVRGKDKFHLVELFCNEVAANALMPSELMRALPKNTFQSGSVVFRTAKTIGISSFAFLVRALELNLISLDKYRELKHVADADFREFLKKEAAAKERQKDKKGGPNPYLLLLNKNGRLFTQVVLDAFRSGSLPPAQASNLLKTKVTSFSKFEDFLYK